MADEARIVTSLNIRKNNLVYQGQPTAFTADVSGQFGPSPGAMTVPVQGIEVDLSRFTVPGLMRISNLESDGGNYFEWGIYDPETLAFFPLGECLPGESYVVRLSRNIKEQYYGTGTGTSAGGETNKLWAKAFGGSGTGDSVRASFEGFEA